MFWLAESRPIEKFAQNHLIDRLIDALMRLKSCIESKCLPSYMIAERNLFAGRIADNEREVLMRTIGDLIDARENQFKQFSKLNPALHKVLDAEKSFAEEADNRNKIENLVLKKNIIFKETEDVRTPSGNELTIHERLNQNEAYLQYEKKLQGLVLPDKQELSQNSEHVFRQRLYKILS